MQRKQVYLRVNICVAFRCCRCCISLFWGCWFPTFTSKTPFKNISRFLKIKGGGSARAKSYALILEVNVWISLNRSVLLYTEPIPPAISVNLSIHMISRGSVSVEKSSWSCLAVWEEEDLLISSFVWIMSKWSQQRKCVTHLNLIITYYIIITANSSLDGPRFGFPSLFLKKSGG